MRTVFHIFAFVFLLAFSTACHRGTGDFRRSLQAATQLQVAEGSPKVLAAYQPWFGNSKHIDVGYSTQDPAVLVRQINEAKELGISGFVVNWYGPRKPFEDKSYMLLQKAAAENNFTVSLMYDEDTEYPGQSTEAVIVDLQYAYDRYIGPHALPTRSAYLRYNGRPVIFIFPKQAETDWNRIRQLVNSWEDPPLLIFKDIYPKYANAFDGFYAWVQPGKEGWKPDGSNWGEQYLTDFYKQMTTEYPNKIAVGAAWPGFDDRQASWSRNRRMSDRCGKTFEESLRLFRRYYPDSKPLPFLMVVTWNDYEEGTAIERGFSRCNVSGGSTSGR
ncbi:MAG TPA: hypothetical protein VN577_18130 [Terriglobales bacterium]|nr:hypothetical protein [Terriglobales bacterium]